MTIAPDAGSAWDDAGLDRNQHSWRMSIAGANAVCILVTFALTYVPAMTVAMARRRGFALLSGWLGRAKETSLEPAAFAMALAAVILTLWISTVLTPQPSQGASETREEALRLVLIDVATLATYAASVLCWLLTAWALANPPQRLEAILTIAMAVLLASLAGLRRVHEAERARWLNQAIALERKLANSPRGMATDKAPSTGIFPWRWAGVALTIAVVGAVTAGCTYQQMVIPAGYPSSEGWALGGILIGCSILAFAATASLLRWRDQMPRESQQVIGGVCLGVVVCAQAVIIGSALYVLGSIRYWAITNAPAVPSELALPAALASIATVSPTLALLLLANSGKLDDWFNQKMMIRLENARSRVAELRKDISR